MNSPSPRGTFSHWSDMGDPGGGILGFGPPGKTFLSSASGRTLPMPPFWMTKAATVREVYVFDFDGSDETTNILGGGTLGNDIETTLGFGDSGGPAFIFADGTYQLAGINTFIARFTGYSYSPPLFGSAGGRHHALSRRGMDFRCRGLVVGCERAPSQMSRVTPHSCSPEIMSSSTWTCSIWPNGLPDFKPFSISAPHISMPRRVT